MEKNKKIIITVAVILAVIAVIATIFLVNKSKKEDGKELSSKLNIQSVEEMESLVDKMYEGVETFQSLATTRLDLNDKNMVSSITGLDSTEKIDAVVVSEPMMSAQAYSMVLVKVKDAKDANEIAKKMNESVNPNKWICVSAEKIYTTSSDNIVCLVMANEEMAKPVFENFKKLAGKIGQEYVREGNNGIIDDPELW